MLMCLLLPPKLTTYIPRPPDDFQPRAQIKKEHNSGALKLEDEESLRTFSEKYCVAVELVRQYLQHLNNMERIRLIKMNERQKLKEAKKRKKYTDYNWKELVETDHISDLTVPELNKYLTKHNLQLKGKKNVKLDTIKPGPFLRIFPWGGGAFFEKGPFCEIIY